MALINGALQIGRSALTASQAALQVTGNNMANSATPGYSRQRVNLTPTQYTEIVPGKYTGTGVSVYSVTRLVDEALNQRIRTAVSDSASYDVQQQAMTRVEAVFNELTDEDLSSQLDAFFESWGKLQNDPDNETLRSNVILEGKNLCNLMQQMRSELISIQEGLDTQVRSQVAEADSLSKQIAELNEQITVSEAGQAGSSAALRDQRDQLLKQLSELVEINVREVDGGSVNVFIGSEPLIQYSQSRGLTYVEKEDANGVIQSKVVFSNNQGQADLTSGKIGGLLIARDEQLGGVIGELDDWANSLIYEVNVLHSQGQGLTGFESVTGSYRVDDADASLADIAGTGLSWAVTNGVINVQVYDKNTAQTVTTQISIREGMDGNDMSQNDLVTALNGVGNITASVDGEGRLKIEANSGYTFSFSSPADTGSMSNVLAVLGINTFFEGTNADSIQVNSSLTAGHLAAGSTSDATNGDIAGMISDLAATGVSSLDGASLVESYTAMVGQIAVDAKSAQDNYAAADVVLLTLENERESISGVSVNEEAISMITYQKMFQGAARYISVIDELLDDVIGLVG